MHYIFIITKFVVTNLIRTNEVLENGLKTSIQTNSIWQNFYKVHCDCRIRKAVVMKV
jgi:hypothetical protein